MTQQVQSFVRPPVAPETVEEVRGATRRLDVQGLRAIAVLLVVGYHAGLPLPGGFVGVDVFFVVSGFVITAMLQREWRSTGRIRFGRFYLRRFKRLTPALALMVATTVLLGALFLSPLGPQQSTAQTAVGAMFLVANAVIARTTGDYFDGPAENNALLHTWSLSVEEQFYLGFPLLLALSWMLARRFSARSTWASERIAAFVVGAVGVGSFALAVAVSRGLTLEAGEMLVGFYGPLTRVWEFAAGALLVLVPGLGRARGSSWALTSAVLGGALVVASVALISATTPFPGLWTLLPVLGTVLLIHAGVNSNAVSGVLETMPMVRVGDWSYSIYLWHWPFIVFAGALWPQSGLALPLAAVLSFGVAIASYTWVEQPLRRLEPASPIHWVRLVAVTAAPPLVLAAVLGFATEHGFWSSTVRAHQAAVLKDHTGCYDLGPLSGRTAAACTSGSAAAGVPIYLVGDSHAQHFTEAVRGAGQALAQPVAVSTSTNCPVVDLELRMSAAPPAHDARCQAFVRGTLDYLRRTKPGVVVLAASDRYWTDTRFSAGVETGVLSADSHEKLATLDATLESTVAGLHEAGHRVLIVYDVPRWDGADEWSPVDCTVVALVTPVGSCERRMPTSRAEDRQGATRQILRSVADRTGAGLLDPWSRMCPDGWCANHDGGVTTYRDTNHITVHQSRALAEDFRRAIAELAVAPS